MSQSSACANVRHQPLSQYSAQLNDALYRQKTRLEAAWAIEQEIKRQRKAAAGPEISTRGKHPLEPESSAQAAKRARHEGFVTQGNGKGKGPEVDVSLYALDDVVDVVMAGLTVVDAELMRAAFDVSQIVIMADFRMRDKIWRNKIPGRCLY